MKLYAAFPFVALAFASLALISQTSPLSKAQGAASTMVAPTPPMGWNSWNFLRDKVDDKGVRAAADSLVASGMRDAGYTYVNIDDTWEGGRDANGVMHANSKFPDMKALADYVHSKGLKLGIYTSPGPKTCMGYEGSQGHEEQDAQLFASWGIDYVKYDLCSFRAVMTGTAPNDGAAQMLLMENAYARMGKALKATGRPMVYSFSIGGWDAAWEWAASAGANLWRTTRDIRPNWDRIYAMLSQQSGLEKYAGPGHWNDPDMLEVGNGDLTLAEDRSHFSMWAMLAAPLLAGNSLPDMKPEVREVLMNRDVIAIDQDRLGREGSRVYSEGEVDVWTRHLSGGALAVAILNAGADRYSRHPFELNLARLGLHGVQKGKDLWTGKEIELKDHELIELPIHGILLVRIASPK